MKWKLIKNSPESYVLWGFIGFFVTWLLAGVLYSTRLDFIQVIIKGFWQGLIFGGVPVWLAGLIKYKFLYKKPLVVVKAYNGHIEGEIQYFKDEENIESRINKLKYSLNLEKVDLYFYSEQDKLKIDYKGGIETRTEIFTKLMNFFDTQIKFKEL